MPSPKLKDKQQKNLEEQQKAVAEIKVVAREEVTRKLYPTAEITQDAQDTAVLLEQQSKDVFTKSAKQDNTSAHYPILEFALRHPGATGAVLSGLSLGLMILALTLPAASATVAAAAIVVSIASEIASLGFFKKCIDNNLGDKKLEGDATLARPHSA